MQRAFTAVCTRFVQIGARHHDERIAAAQFQHRLLDLLSALAGHFRPAGSLPVSVAATTRLSSSTRATCDDPMSSVRNSPFEKPARHRISSIASARLRNVGRVLQQSRIARHQRRRGKSKHLPERKIPRHHRQHHAQRLVRDEAFPRVGRHFFIGQEFLGVFRVIAAGPARTSALHRPPTSASCPSRGSSCAPSGPSPIPECPPLCASWRRDRRTKCADAHETRRTQFGFWRPLPRSKAARKCGRFRRWRG